MTGARVFTIPPSAAFLPTLIEALVDGRLIPGFAPGADPLALADVTLYLPTRRACRLARDQFLAAGTGDAVILPRIVAIGDIDEDEFVFAEQPGADALDLPPALAGLERRLLLTELVLKWATQITPVIAGEAPLVANTPGAALALADDLARLIDDMTMRQVAWSRLDELVPEGFDRYWQLTLGFLKIAREVWPAILAERGLIEPAERRDRLIALEAARIARSTGPVIAAGSTGSIPATATLIAAVARAPQGAVVLPGLDTDLDEASWQLIDGEAAADGHRRGAPACGHPQFALHGLLQRLNVGRADVATLTAPAAWGRERFVSEALRPAATTELWRERLPAHGFADVLDRVTVIEAAHAEDEALAIAVALREAVETPHQTAALITPDRSLARRVLAALARWDVPVDDSGGDKLSDTAAGVFARLAAKAALGGVAPVDLLALLKHPLFRLGSADGHAGVIAILERAVLRGPRPRPGTAGLAAALQAFAAERADLHGSDPRKTISDNEIARAEAFVAHLAAALAPLESGRGMQPLGTLAVRHADTIAALSQDESGAMIAFVGADGMALQAALEEVASCPPAGQLAVTGGDYPELFEAAIADRVVRRPGAAGARVRILGPLEARLAEADRVVLGGLVEGTWPPETQADAWLSRPMRLDLGLDLPERRIGLSAHDFAQMLGAREVFLSRADKLGGAPTVPARFLQRLAAVAATDAWKAAVARGRDYLAWARRLDDAGKPVPEARPAPTPPREVRPRQLSVTEIEHWLRDPYTIYARHILKLRPLDPVDLPVGLRDRGILIHDAIRDFSQTYATKLPPDPEAALIDIGARHFAPLAEYPEARAFWWPRFLRIARWFAAFDAERRAHARTIAVEIRGVTDVTPDFRLTTRADRIERLKDGRYAILDFKTGQVPTEKQVRLGLAPQLTLEAAILQQAGFATLPPDAVAELSYVALKGGEPAGRRCPIEFKDGGSPDAHAAIALAKLKDLALRFADPAQPYRALVMPMWRGRYGIYDHLARVKEWSLTGGVEGDDA